MKKLLTTLIVTLVIFTIGVITVIIDPSGRKDFKNSKPDVEFLNDQANLLTEEDQAILTNKLHEISDQLKTQIVIYTTPSSYLDLDDEASNYLEDHGFAKNCVIIAVNMDPYNREVLISGYGKAKFLVNNKRAQSITDAMVSDLKNADYISAFDYALSCIQDHINHPAGAIFPVLGIGLLISIVLSGIIVFIMVSNSGGVNTTNSRTYLDKDNSRVLAKRDIYTHTTKKKTKKSSSSSSKGGSGGHGSHSTGRSSF